MSHKLLTNVILDGVLHETGEVVNGLDESVAANLVERGLAEVSTAAASQPETPEQPEATATPTPLDASSAPVETPAPEAPQPTPEQITEDLAATEASPTPPSNVQIN